MGTAWTHSWGCLPHCMLGYTPTPGLVLGQNYRQNRIKSIFRSSDNTLIANANDIQVVNIQLLLMMLLWITINTFQELMSAANSGMTILSLVLVTVLLTPSQ